MTKEQFEREAYQGYVSYGFSMSDGYYSPISFEQFLIDLRREPVTPETFRYGTDFKPTKEQCDAYNA